MEQNNDIQNYSFEYKGWIFSIPSFHSIYKKWRLRAENETMSEYVFIEEQCLSSEEAFQKECKRVYVNRLCCFEEE